MTPEELVDLVGDRPMVEALAIIATELSLVPEIRDELANRAGDYCRNCRRTRRDHINGRCVSAPYHGATSRHYEPHREQS